MPVGDKIIPNIIGVDIGCGMTAAEIVLPNISLAEMDARIRKWVPVGFNLHPFSPPALQKFLDLGNKVGCPEETVKRSLGTLGGGNHFIEIGEYDGRNYVIIHTGSRNLGLRVARFHQEKAAKKHRTISTSDFIGEIKSAYPKEEWGRRITEERNRRREMRVEKDLEYLEGDDVEEYLQDMYTAAEYAEANRQRILSEIIAALYSKSFQEIGSCVHNFISPVDRIIRKGAISAHKGQLVIIPINRTFGTIFGVGKGNPEWNFSAPHGAGRLLSRGKAKELYSQADADFLMGNIFSSNNPVDEADFAYKNPEEILGAIEESVEIKFIVKPILNIKG
jgi:RNA-splicing ligase RtcB